MNSVRIIAGSYRRRVLRFPAMGKDFRPTPDRVRETLFNWLGQDLSGCSCLDLFAGSGALGFEAASRGAKKVVMVEHARPAIAALLANAGMLGSDTVEIVCRDALEFARSIPPDGRFDIVFLDPPYRQGWIDRLTPELPRMLRDGGMLYVEAEYPITTIAGWQVIKQSKAGQVFYHLLRQENADDK